MSVSIHLEGLGPHRDPGELEAALLGAIRGLGRVVVAFSGGIDSTLVLAAAVRAVGAENCVGVIGVSPSLAARELAGAIEIGREVGARVERLETHELEVEGYRLNGPDRCYFCKSELYTALAAYLSAKGYTHVLDGTNADDRLELRPGHKAAQELGVRSLLRECGFGKADIRTLASRWGVRNWNKPASPCLSSRIPHYSEVTVDKLSAIEQAEALLAGMGFEDFRVRHHGDVARIELRPGDWPALLKDGVRQDLTSKFRQLGFKHVSMDLDGLRPGGLSEAVKGV